MSRILTVAVAVAVAVAADRPGAYPTIGAALLDAPDGATVVIAAGAPLTFVLRPDRGRAQLR